MVALNSSVLCAQAGHCPSSPAFARPFPPPALENVPLPYILDQLHNLAVNYWDKPHTADCTVIVPIVPQHCPARNSIHCSSNGPLSAPLPHQYGSSGLSRRASETVASASRPTRMTSKLHLDYLLAQSSLFRDLFSGRPFAAACPESSSSPTNLPRTALPPHRQPHIMPSVPSHPVIHLPLPDPSSFPHLVHFMYFGTFDVLENALEEGSIQWAGVVRNVEYLGMRSRIKAFLGRWYARCMGPGSPPVVCGEDGEGDFRAYGSDFDEDEDSSSDEDDDEDCYSDYGSDMSDTDGSLETLVDDEPVISAFAMKISCDDVQMTEMDADIEPPRGRSRTRNSPKAASFSPTRWRTPA